MLPELVDDCAAALAALAAAERAAAIAPDPLRRLAAILPRDADVAARIAARLKLSKKARQRLADAGPSDLGANPHALAYRLGTTGAQDRLLIADNPAAAAR